MIGFLSRSLMVLIGSLTMRAHSSELLAMFYPLNRDLYLSLGIAFPAFICLLIVGFREKIWAKHRTGLFLLIKPLLFLSLLADLFLHVYFAHTQSWLFSWIIACTLLIDSLFIYFLLKDQHTKLMVQDWRTEKQH